MKFSHTLQFNSSSDWAEHYIAYSNLKKLIYQIEKDIISTTLGGQGDIEETSHPTEETALLGAKSRANKIFALALDKELDKITTFYHAKEKALLEDAQQLFSDIHSFENTEGAPLFDRSLQHRRSFDSTDSLSHYWHQHGVQRSSDTAASFLSSDDDETEFGPSTPINEERNPLTGDNRGTNFLSYRILEAQRIRFKKRTSEQYVLLSDLKSFVHLNHTGFGKILKKYDKVTSGPALKPSYMNNVVNEGYPFKKTSRQTLDHHIRQLEELYAKCIDSDVEVAKKELKNHLREFIVWERNTVWRDIISLERKSQAVGIKIRPTIEDQTKVSKIETPFGKVDVSRYWKTSFILSLCIGVFAILLKVEIFQEVEVRNCFALLVFVSLLWATEVIPLFVTSLSIPLLVVFLGVMRSDDGPLSAHDATERIFSAMFSPVIMLLLGGFAIAAALSKHHIAKMIATIVLSKAGTKPSRVLLANMLVATVASMWISNVAAPVLCLSLIQPILRNLPPNSTFGRCLILGIALASNVGGMASPISSPQNIIAIKNMEPEPSWVEWFIVVIPLCIIVDLLVWLLLLWNYQPGKASQTIHPIRASKDPWTGTQIFIICVTLVTIALWCVEKKLEGFVGDMGIIAVIPLVLFFGTGILTKEDFNNFLWTVIILAMGGIALGKAVYSSGLLANIANQIKDMVDGLTVWQIMVVFCVLILVFATFISHTVSAIIILPIVAQVGDSLEDGSSRNLLVLSATLMCSTAMGLPVSGFPNMNAIMMEDEMGVRYLSTKDFLKTGVPSSVLSLIVIITIGYALIHFVIGY